LTAGGVRGLERDAWGAALVLGNLGFVIAELGDLAAGAAALAEALEFYRELSSPAGAAATLDRLAGALTNAGRDETAARLLGAATAARGRTHGGLNQPDRETALTLLDARLGPERLASFLGEGELLDLEAGIAYGLDAARSAVLVDVPANKAVAIRRSMGGAWRRRRRCASRSHLKRARAVRRDRRISMQASSSFTFATI